MIPTDPKVPKPPDRGPDKWLDAAVTTLIAEGIEAVKIDRLAVASMERRSGPEYDFCEPLLAAVLRSAELARGHVVVARQFFSPGRHAGPAGDIADICKAAEQERPGLKTHLTGLMGEDPRLIEVLADRYREARASAPV